MSDTPVVTGSGLRRFLRAFALVCAVLLGVLVITGGALAVSSSFRETAMQTTLKVMGADLEQDEHGFTNLLIIGTGDRNHDGADLTDTMIVASIDPVDTRSVVMLSLPRDLYLEGGTYGDGRINAIYANRKYRLVRDGLEEEEASKQALEDLAAEIGGRLGISIHGVLKADFTAFEQVVDAVGGVDVVVAEDLTDYSYPLSETRIGTFSIKAGPQHLDGETALKYARSRHSTNDFDRSARQQQILQAIAAKARSMGRFDQAGLLLSLNERLQGHVETTMDTDELLGLAQIASVLSLDRMVRMQVNFTAGSDYYEAAAGGFVYSAPPELFEGASVLLPTASPSGKNDWSQMRTFAQMLLLRRDLYLQNKTLVIRDAAKLPQGHRLRNELLRYGWNVLPLEESEATESGVTYGSSESKDAASFIGTLLTLPVTQAEEGALTGSGDIVITLAPGYAFKPFVTMSGAVLGIEN